MASIVGMETVMTPQRANREAVAISRFGPPPSGKDPSLRPASAAAGARIDRVAPAQAMLRTFDRLPPSRSCEWSLLVTGRSGTPPRIATIEYLVEVAKDWTLARFAAAESSEFVLVPHRFELRGARVRRHALAPDSREAASPFDAIRRAPSTDRVVTQHARDLAR